MSVEISLQENCFHITLNKPEKHNAFDSVLVEQLTEAFNAASSSECRSVLLSGSGKSFSAGADLNVMKAMASSTQEENKKDSGKLFEMFQAGALCKKPIIGQVHGNVMGGGLGLVAICDIVAAENSTQFCFSEVKLGLVPAVISPFVLRKMNVATAKELMLTGKPFTAKDAKESGLVHFIGTASDVEEYVQQQQQQFLKLGPEAVAATKSLINDILFSPWEKTKTQTTDVIAERRASQEGQEGLKSFFEKRKPSWNKG